MGEMEALLSTKCIFLQPMLLKVRTCVVPQEYLRSEIPSRPLATFQIIGKHEKRRSYLNFNV